MSSMIVSLSSTTEYKRGVNTQDLPDVLLPDNIHKSRGDTVQSTRVSVGQSQHVSRMVQVLPTYYISI